MREGASIGPPASPFLMAQMLIEPNKVTLRGSPAEVKALSKRLRKRGYTNDTLTEHPSGWIVLTLTREERGSVPSNGPDRPE